jgi:hypothetical protein
LKDLSVLRDRSPKGSAELSTSACVPECAPTAK